MWNYKIDRIDRLYGRARALSHNSKERENSMFRHFSFKRLFIIPGACVLLIGMMLPLVAFSQSTAHTASDKGKGYSFFGDAKLVKPGNHSAHSVLLESAASERPG